MKSNKFWIILLCSIVIICAGFIFAQYRTSAEWAFIYQDGILLEYYDLTNIPEPISLMVESGSGVNQIDIEHGRIRVSHANCPDGLCVRQGWVSSGTIPIVCLPHRLIISFDNDFDRDFDAVTG